MTETPLTLPDLELVRHAMIRVDLRAAGDITAPEDSLGLMDVRFSPFGDWYRIDSWFEGTFLERSVPGAFKRTINAHNAAQGKDAHRIRSMFNHGMDMQIDQKLLGDVLQAAEDPDSPRITVGLWDTSYNRDLLPGLRSGAYGSSFMFRVVRDEWDHEPGVSGHNPDGLPERTLKEVRVEEAGPVTWPANASATAGMRAASGTDSFYDALSRRDPSRVEALRSKISALRSAGPATGTPAGDGPAPAAPVDGPPQGTRQGLTAAQRRERLYPDLKG